MPFSKLLSEIIISIAKQLETEKDIFSLLRTCARNYHLLLSSLYKHNVDFSSGSALIWYVIYGNEVGVRLLLGVGASAMNGKETLYSASKLLSRSAIEVLHFAQNETMTKLLLNNEADMEDSPDRWGSLLHAAITKGNLSLAKFLLENGANVNRSNWWGATPLHIAAGQGLLDLANVLLDHGADVNFYNSGSIRRHYHCGMPLHSTLYRNDNVSLQMIDLFVKYGVDLERDVFLNAPLLFASRYCRVKTARILINHGSLVDAKNGNGRTPLHQVATRHKEGLGIAKLLLDHSAPVNAQDNDNITAPCMAARGYIDIMKLLLTYGARVNLPNRDGICPLHVTVTGKNLDIAKLLLVDYGAPDNSATLHCTMRLLWVCDQ